MKLLLWGCATVVSGTFLMVEDLTRHCAWREEEEPAAVMGVASAAFLTLASSGWASWRRGSDYRFTLWAQHALEFLLAMLLTGLPFLLLLPELRPDCTTQEFRLKVKAGLLVVGVVLALAGWVAKDLPGAKREGPDPHGR